ncbi:MAG: MGMT family protein [Armatimonadota bacterium]|nr:MGMT family protein [Armatimonadota bacterium]MDR7462967.1 MGMT family protein [Armatimonadota bacterium]MDR7565765.1 MGMT family protein [Armatimonadota bacterium]
MSAGEGFRERVLAVVAAIPRGRVLTYGEVAALAGRPRSAREVGWIAHASTDDLPWHRVVNRFGGLASGYAGGPGAQARALRQEGVRVRRNLTVDLARYRWTPSDAELARLLGGSGRPGNPTFTAGGLGPPPSPR